jgi:K+/H+ antiporter YhaU regulatory subunit KhtT
MVKGKIKTEEIFNFTLKPNDVVEKGDVLVMIGQEEDLDRFCADV